MIPTSFRTRSLHFAFLFGPPRQFTRADAVAVYDAVCGALGVDDIALNFGSPPAAAPQPAGVAGIQPFAIQLQRRMGRGGLSITLDTQGSGNPIRLLMESVFPATAGEGAYQDFDLAINAAFAALNGPFSRVMAEARIRGQVEAAAGSAIDFVACNILRLSEEEIAALGTTRISFGSIALEVPPGAPLDGDELKQPKREMKAEVLREDPRCIYVELMSQWPQVVFNQGSGGAMEIDPQQVRQLKDEPSAYLRDAFDYMTDHFLPLLAARREDTGTRRGA